LQQHLSVFRKDKLMIMVRAIVRPEKCAEVLAALMYAGFPAVTKMDVYGRGKQRGMRVGEVTYDELPKEMIFTVVKESDKDFVVKVILQSARSGQKGAYGDGKVFVSPVDEVYTISSGVREDAVVTV
jgi:nitrogen regulatory protein PII 1